MTPAPAVSTLLRGGVLATGERADVRVRAERVVDVAAALTPDAADDVVDIEGYVVVPAATEPHAHLDKAFLAERIANPSGDLLGAIWAMEENRHLLGVAETIERAERAVRTMAANGVTAIRSHADVTPAHGLRSIEALTEVRHRVADVADLQVVALVSWPVTGVAGADNVARLRDALDMGADLVGGCPHLDSDPHDANAVLLGVAGDHGVGVDLHTDETLDPTIMAVEDLARRVIAEEFPHGVTASHCLSLGMQPVERQREVADLIALAGIHVVALPQTNLFIQGRDHQQAMPRALTAVRALREAGVNVAAGADNLQDPFNPMGRADPLEIAALMVVATHLAPVDAWHACSAAARRALGLPEAGPEVGAVADLVAVRGATLREAVAFAPSARIVMRRGRLLDRAETQRSHRPDLRSSVQT